MNKTDLFAIIAKTNSYIAQRDSRFSGKTMYVVSSNLSLRDAQRQLLAMYNDAFCAQRPSAPHWGIAVLQSRRHSDGAGSHSDGTRFFEYDSRLFCIVPMSDIELL